MNMQPWTAETFEFKDFDFQQILDDDGTLSHWFQRIWTHVLCLVKGVPTEYGQLNILGDRASPIGLKRTNYGLTFPGKDKPDIQMLHCIEQAHARGDNIFVDTFQGAQNFKRDYPEQFELLSTHPFTYDDEGSDEYGPFDLRCERPVIEHTATDKLSNVNLSNFTRDSFLNLKPEQEVTLMDTYFKFSEYVNRPEYCMTNRMDPGDMVCFNNNRVLHGRKEFNLHSGATSQSLIRRLEGGYLDWDLVYSRLRVLKESKEAESTM